MVDLSFICLHDLPNRSDTPICILDIFWLSNVIDPEPVITKIVILLVIEEAGHMVMEAG